ncbi:hypothetical protein M8J77_009138 [Diaphorina citri]|nr:hypothetical protein M8J77_009138 [Diaphorina citri]
MFKKGMNCLIAIDVRQLMEQEIVLLMEKNVINVEELDISRLHVEATPERALWPRWHLLVSSQWNNIWTHSFLWNKPDCADFIELLQVNFRETEEVEIYQ